MSTHFLASSWGRTDWSLVILSLLPGCRSITGTSSCRLSSCTISIPAETPSTLATVMLYVLTISLMVLMISLNSSQTVNTFLMISLLSYFPAIKRAEGSFF